jgi:hypothetical protein
MANIQRAREEQLDDCIVAILGSQNECRRTTFSLCVNGNFRVREEQLDDCIVAILGGRE